MENLKGQILNFLGYKENFTALSQKKRNILKKRFNLFMKELEHLMRNDGVTLIVGDNTIITTYMNNSLHRKRRKQRAVY